MNTNSEIGDRIKTLRNRQNLTQLDIAHALQISPQAVSRWENGENLPDISLLVPLSRLLAVSTDKLLGQYDFDNSEIWGSIFISEIKGSTQTMASLTNSEAAIWLNGIYHQMTESTLQFGGLPVKYIGGGFLCLFTGPDSEIRSINAALQAKKILTENLSIGLHCGDVYYSTIGHRDYSSKDILGITVNAAFRIESLESVSGIKASAELVNKADFKNYDHIESISLKGLPGPIEVCDIIID
jgi:class 3 adenylate cyclase